MSRFAVAAALLLTTAGAVHAQTNTGTRIGQFMLIEPGARVAAMGNAGVSAFEGLQGAYYNPAAIGLLSRWELMFTHAAWLADIRYEYAAAGVPLGGLGNVFASVTALNSGDIDVRTVEQPLGTGERYSVSDVAIGVGYGRRLTDRVAAGAAMSYLQERIWHSTAGTMTFSLGTLYQLWPNGLRIGASLSNFGTDARFEGRDLRIIYDYDPGRFGDNNTLPGERFTSSYPVPQLFRVGIGVPWRVGHEHRFYAAADAQHPSDNTESVSLGAEYAYRGLLALRIGYRELFLKDAEGGLTFGIGAAGSLESFGYRLDYAWADHGRLEDTHRVTFGIVFLQGESGP